MSRVLFTCADLSGGGGERELATLVGAIDPARHDVHLVLWREVRAWPVPAHVRVTILDKTRPWHLPRTVARMRSTLSTLRPDVVVSVMPFPALVTGLALGPGPRWIPRFVSDPELDLPRWLRPTMRTVLRRAERIHGCSRGVAGALEAALRLPPGRVEAWDNPVDLDALLAAPMPEPEGPPVLLVAGRLVAAEAVDRALAAFAQVPAPAELWVLGDGPLRAELGAVARALGVAERVRFLGRQPDPERWMRRARALVLTSRSEGLPNVMIEAMACGVPVIAVDCRFGPAELIEDGETGWLVAEGDTAGLIRAMRRVLTDPVEARRRAEAARVRIAARFGDRRALRRYVDLVTPAPDGTSGG